MYGKKRSGNFRKGQGSIFIFPSHWPTHPPPSSLSQPTDSLFILLRPSQSPSFFPPYTTHPSSLPFLRGIPHLSHWNVLCLSPLSVRIEAYQASKWALLILFLLLLLLLYFYSLKLFSEALIARGFLKIFEGLFSRNESLLYFFFEFEEVENESCERDD